MFSRYTDPILHVHIVGNLVRFARGEGLNVKVKITRSIEAVPDRCEIAIENLDPARALLMGRIARETTAAQLVAVQIGYESIPVSAFTGRLESFDENRQIGPALWTLATAGDGAEAFSDRNLPVDMKSNAGMTPSHQIDLALAVLAPITKGPSVDPIVNLASPVAQGPFAASGVRKATDVLDAVCRTLRCRWWIRDGMLHLARNGLPVAGAPAVVIAPQQPGPRFPGVPLIAPVSFGAAGLMSASTFLDPSIVPGGQVSYQGGAFRVEHVVHSLETRSASPWVSRTIGRSL